VGDPVAFAEARLAEDDRRAFRWSLPERIGLYATRRRGRMRREVIAGRRILERHRPDEYGCQLCAWSEGVICPDLRDLLYRWADHPGYRQACKP